jgi:large subunit ribosomal protein L20
MTHKRHKKIIDQASGYYGAKNNLFKTANEAVQRSGNFAYRDRRNKSVTSAACGSPASRRPCRNGGTTYSAFIAALNGANIALDRKVLSDMAITDPAGFSALLRQVGLSQAAA